MVVFSPIRATSHPHWAFLIECYEVSFPINERRPIEALESLLRKTNFSCNVLVKNEEPVGLFFSWHLGEFRYIEHFAIASNFQRQNLGKTALRTFLTQSALPVILEVEPPDAELARQRIRFYEQEDFVLNQTVFVQPPYSSQQKTVELRLMEWGGKLLEREFEIIKSTLYRQVYKYVKQ
jgi:ribosomal protein S18 acetylase RimI-like enzyme